MKVIIDKFQDSNKTLMLLGEGSWWRIGQEEDNKKFDHLEESNCLAWWNVTNRMRLKYGFRFCTDSPGQLSSSSWWSWWRWWSWWPPLHPCPGILLPLAGMTQHVTRDITHVTPGKITFPFSWILESSSVIQLICTRGIDSITLWVTSFWIRKKYRGRNMKY